MRIRKKKWAVPELDACNFFVKEPRSYRGKWNTLFKSNSPLHLELGCGKGTFAGRFALDHPNINLIAIDIKNDMLGVARRNISSMFEENGKAVENVMLVAQNVEQIDALFSSDDKIDRIYINFCNPWPRGKHKKRRLTYPKKLVMYRDFLTDGGEIHFKTDDDELFAESLEYFKIAGFDVTYITYDLHNSDVTYNIVTEHENMFSQMGIKIKYCIAKKSVLPQNYLDLIKELKVNNDNNDN